MSQGLVVHAALFSASSGQVFPLGAGDTGNVARTASNAYRYVRLYSFTASCMFF